jgi:hypothetical protein
MAVTSRSEQFPEFSLISGLSEWCSHLPDSSSGPKSHLHFSCFAKELIYSPLTILAVSFVFVRSHTIHDQVLVNTSHTFSWYIVTCSTTRQSEPSTAWTEKGWFSLSRNWLFHKFVFETAIHVDSIQSFSTVSHLWTLFHQSAQKQWESHIKQDTLTRITDIMKRRRFAIKGSGRDEIGQIESSRILKRSHSVRGTLSGRIMPNRTVFYVLTGNDSFIREISRVIRSAASGSEIRLFGSPHQRRYPRNIQSFEIIPGNKTLRGVILSQM